MTDVVWTFVYDIELTHEQNPPGTMDRLREDLRSLFIEHHMNYGMGALGGNRHCYGTVDSTDKQIATSYRDTIAEWIQTQRFNRNAHFGPVEDTKPDIMAPITHIVFTVENLTEADRAEAARHHADIRKQIQAKRPN